MKRSHLITAAVLAAGLLAAECGSAASSIAPVQTLSQPTSVGQIAAQLHLTGLTVCGPAPLGGLTDSGVAYRGRERIGIDTFPGPAPQRALGPR